MSKAWWKGQPVRQIKMLKSSADRRSVQEASIKVVETMQLPRMNKSSRQWRRVVQKARGTNQTMQPCRMHTQSLQGVCKR